MKKKHKKTETSKSLTAAKTDELKAQYPKAVAELEEILADANFENVTHAMSQRGKSAETMVVFMKKQGVLVYVDDFKTAEISEMITLVGKALENREQFITISTELKLKAKQAITSEPAHKDEYVEPYSVSNEMTALKKAVAPSCSESQNFSSYTGMNYAVSNRFLDGVPTDEFDGMRTFI